MAYSHCYPQLYTKETRQVAKKRYTIGPTCTAYLGLKPRGSAVLSLHKVIASLLSVFIVQVINNWRFRRPRSEAKTVYYQEEQTQ